MSNGEKIKTRTGERVHGYTGGRTGGRSERGRANGFTDARVDGRMHDRGDLVVSNTELGIRARVRLHRALVMDVIRDTEGRTLRKNEHVHHVDENTGNNQYCNLRVMSRREHLKLHASGCAGKKRKRHRKARW